MSLFFNPSNPMPADESALEQMVWYCVWDHPWRSDRLLSAGSTVFLVDASADVVRWEIELTDVFAAPFESTDAFRDHLQRRWGTRVTPLDGDGPSPGFGVAWKARPVRRLEVKRPVGSPELEQWESSCGLDEGWRLALDLPTSDCGCCTS